MKNSIFWKITILLLVAIQAAFAEDNVPYLDATGAVQTANGVTVIDAANVNAIDNLDGWYLVRGNLGRGSMLTVEGTAHLILEDNSDLKVSSAVMDAGINVSGSNALNIYAQSTGSDMGKLTAGGSQGYRGGAGIGSSGAQYSEAAVRGGTITIRGGNIVATGNGGGYGSGGGAGIGGGHYSAGGTVTISGGIVTATGGEGGAGIGGGMFGYDGGVVNIAGGTVTATGSGGGAGIGGGAGENGGTVTISGGTVVAIGSDDGYGGSGIGSGSSGFGATGGTLRLNGDAVVFANRVNATQTLTSGILFIDDISSGRIFAGTPVTVRSPAAGLTATWERQGGKNGIEYAGSSSGFIEIPGITAVIERKVENNIPYIDENGISQTADNVTVLDETNINEIDYLSGWFLVRGNLTRNATLIAIGTAHLILEDNSDLNVTGNNNGPGINVSGSNALSIYAQSTGDDMGKLTATGYRYLGSGIGSGELRNGGTITIAGGNITATGANYAAGIGGGYSSDGGIITITGGIVTATSGDDGAGIGGGYHGENGPITITGGTVTATGSTGIGGGACAGNGGGVSISGGEVKATGNSGAGVGGGVSGGSGCGTGFGGTINITGGTLLATGGIGSAGIGGGAPMANGGSVSINGGNVVAIGGGDASGIGAGVGGTSGSFELNGSAAVLANNVTATGANLKLNDGIFFTGSIGSGSIFAGTPVTVRFPASGVEAAWEQQGGKNGIAYTGSKNGFMEISGITLIVPNIVNNVPYIDENGISQTADNVAVIDETNIDEIGNLNGWYLVSGNLTRNSSIMAGTAHLILENNSDLKITGSSSNAGINVSGGNSLSIYAQSAGSDMGKLAATGDGSAAGIGGVQLGSGGEIIIAGGNIRAISGRLGAGIGGGYGGYGGNVTITGGVVTAFSESPHYGAAGIGGGASETNWQSGTLTLKGNAAVLTNSIHTKDDAILNLAGGTMFVSNTLGTGAIFEGTPMTAYFPAAGVAATWEQQGGKNGIAYTNGSKAGFIEVLGITLAERKTENNVPYIDENGVSQTADNVTVLDETNIGKIDYLNGWVLVRGNLERIYIPTLTLKVLGTAHLILENNSELKILGANNAAINVSEGGSLSIYAQSAGSDMGKLEATNGSVIDGAAGIGGGRSGVKNSGTITIAGGNITAIGGNYGAGIGGGDCGDNGTIIITGGIITATSTRNNNNAAGIGAGVFCPAGGGSGGYGGTIIISGGELMVTSSGYGIGGTYGSEIAITGGTIIAISGSGYGIGGSYGSEITLDGNAVVFANSINATQTLSNGILLTSDVTTGNILAGTPVTVLSPATGVEAAWEQQSGKSGAAYTGSKEGFIEIPGITVIERKSIEAAQYIDENGEQKTAYNVTVIDETNINKIDYLSGWYIVQGNSTRSTAFTVLNAAYIILEDNSDLSVAGTNYNAGINVPDGTSLSIYAQSTGSDMGKLTASGSIGGAGIGGGSGVSGGEITIAGGVIAATGSSGAAGIGGGSSGGPGGVITITGGEITATGNSGAGIGGSSNNGIGGIITITGGTIVATGNGGTGIGGSTGWPIGIITITGGTVTATGTGGSYPGIGGNGGVLSPNFKDENGEYIRSSITISGGAVTAIGSGSAAGIGGGSGVNGGEITISGGAVTAIGGSGSLYSGEGAGIGNGYSGVGSEFTLSGNALVFTNKVEAYQQTLTGGILTTIDNTSWHGSDSKTLSPIQYAIPSGYELTIPLGKALTIPNGGTLTIPEGATLTISGTLTNNGTINSCGNIVGIVAGNQPITRCQVITFNANGGTVSPETGTTGIDGKLASLPTPARTSYTFTGWYTEETGGTQVTENTPFSEPATIYARWEFIFYTISFDLNGGTGTAPSNITVASNSTVSEEQMPPTAAFTKSGYENDGKWHTRSEDFTYTEFAFGDDGTAVTANTTLYLKWELSTTPPATYTITFNAVSGTVNPSTGTTNTNGNLASLPTPARTGYTFNGWYTAATGGTQVTTSTVFTENTIIYARWTYVPTPIIANRENPSRTGVAGYAPAYCNLKGEPLGTQKPATPGVYIEKQGKQTKRIVVR